MDAPKQAVRECGFLGNAFHSKRAAAIGPTRKTPDHELAPRMTTQIRSTAGDLWAITSYFNPAGFARRLSNFKLFRERLNVPLVVVELAYGSNFELKEKDADIVVRLQGGAVLWQKERLLNVALQCLPADCRKVAWLDADIFFDSPDWAPSASVLLDRFPLIQAFKQVHYLSEKWTPALVPSGEVQFTRPSVAFSVGSGLPAAACLGHLLNAREGTSAAGFAWAARRELLERHGLFDACILGGGDRALACAATRCFDALTDRHYMNSRQRERYRDWADPFYESVRAEIGYLDAGIFHLWHGAEKHRNTRTRHEGLQRFRFDPFADIAIGANGSWRWNTNKPDMHDYIRGYFEARREDG
jgi:hypothetical protein